MKLKALKLITGELVFGEVEGIEVAPGVTEILMKKPFEGLAAAPGRPHGYMPYSADRMSNAPAAIQINPMNVVWSAPLEDFPEALEIYQEQTFKIQKPDASDSKIII